MSAHATPDAAEVSVRNLTERPYTVHDALPKAMGPKELRRALNLGASTFYRYQKAGKLKRFEFRRPVSTEKRYSGYLVARHLDQGSEL